MPAASTIAALERAGADLVVPDLAELDPDRLDAAVRARQEEDSTNKRPFSS
jgi:hypothetical protein